MVRSLRLFATVSTLIGVLALPIGASAQIVVGNDAKPDVEIDRSVLDSLGPSPTLSDLFLNRPTSLGATPSTPFAGPTSLTPPRLSRHSSATNKLKLKSPSRMSVTLHNPHKAVTPTKKPLKVAAVAPAKTTPLPTVETPRPSPAIEPVEEPSQTPPPVEQTKPVETPSAAQPAETIKPVEVVKPAVKATPAPDSKSTQTQMPPPRPTPTPTPGVSEAPPAPAMPAAPPVETVARAAAPSQPVVDEAPAPAPKPATPPARQEASLAPVPAPRSPQSLPQGAVTITFEPDGAQLGSEARSSLSSLVQRINTDGDLMVTLLAYAAGDEDSASRARHVSLSRALAVRSFLIDQGVRSTRIEVRALGNKIPDGPPDRVDMILQKR